MADIYFTHHAIKRYTKRWRPNYAFNVAMAELIIAARDATRQRENTILGDTVWHATTRDGDSLRLVTKYEDGRVICVTILPQVEVIADDPDLAGEAISSGPTLLEQLEKREARGWPPPRRRRA